MSGTTTEDGWARCKGWIEATLAQSPGFESIADVERKLADGAYQFWPGRGCAIVSEIAQFPSRKVLMVRHGGGDLRELLEDMEPALCAFARGMGCGGIVSEGRKGWERAAGANGYRFAWIAMQKDLG